VTEFVLYLLGVFTGVFVGISLAALMSASGGDLPAAGNVEKTLAAYRACEAAAIRSLLRKSDDEIREHLRGRLATFEQAERNRA